MLFGGFARCYTLIQVGVDSEGSCASLEGLKKLKGHAREREMVGEGEVKRVGDAV